jgi:hypothetical protein
MEVTAVPIYRVTFFLQADNRGWTETFASSLGTVPQVSTAALILAAFRAAVLPSNVSIIGARISDILSFRGSQSINDPLFPLAGGLAAATFGNQSNDALGLKMDAAVPAAHRTFLMRNIPPQIVTGNTYTPTPGWNFLLTQFIGALKLSSQGWAILGRTVQGPRFNDGQQINALGVAGFAANTPFVIGAGTYVAVHRVTGIAPFANRIFKLASQDLVAKTITLRRWGPRPMFPGNFTFTVFDYIAAPIVAVTTSFIRSRKTGRPFGLIRGRRSPVR